MHVGKSALDSIRKLAEDGGALVFTLLALILLIALFTVGYPATAFLAAALTLYVIVNGRNGLLFSAAQDTLKPVIWGLVLAAFWLALVRTFRPHESMIGSFEEGLTTIAIRLEHLSNIGPIGYGGILVGLSLLGSMMRTGVLSTIGKPIKDGLDFSTVVLMTAASFTFFSQLPIELRIRKDWDLEAKYRGWPKERSEEQRKAERYLMTRLGDEIGSMPRSAAMQFRSLFDDIAEQGDYSPLLDYKQLHFGDAHSTHRFSRSFAYPDYPRAGTVTEDIVFTGVEALPVLNTNEMHLVFKNTPVPGSDAQLRNVTKPMDGTNRSLLIALNNSFCNALSDATGGMLGSDRNIAIRFLKAVVELGAERLVEKHANLDPGLITQMPIDLALLLRPETFVRKKVPGVSLEEVALKRKVLAFGFRAEMENAQIAAILQRGGDPSKAFIDGHVDEEASRESSHPDAIHPK